MSIVLNSGAGGATVGTNDVTGTSYQIVNVGFSTAGSAPTQVDATHGLPTNLLLSNTAASVNTGNADAGTLRVVLATNQPSLSNALAVSQSGSWTVTVNGVVADATAFTRGTTLELPVGGVIEALQVGLTTGQTRALSLTTGALLRVDGSNVTQPVSGTVTANQGGANWTINGVQWNGTTVDTNSGNKSAGTLRVVLATDQPSLANALAVSQSGTWTVQPGNTQNTTPWLVQDVPQTSGGLSRNYQIAPATPAKTVVKASAGQLYAIKASNNNATPVYIKLFDVASAGVTLGTTACDDQFEVPGNTAGAGFVYNVDKGIIFATAITAAITGAIASADNTVIAANSVIVTFYFK